MKDKNVVMVAFLVLALAILLNIATFAVLAEQGPATDVMEFKRVPVDLAAQALKAGDIDYYIFGLRPAQAEALKGDPDIVLYYAPAGLVDIVLNPAPAKEGGLNPLSIREVRLALNYLVDRDYIVNQIYKGFAAPMVTFLSSYDPDFVTIYDIVAKYDFKYDPVTANNMITQALTKAGATKVGGKWYYGGKPIVLNFIIRIEDERREIGDAFASALESMGFTVNRLYMAFGQAIPIVYGTDPAEHQWDLYTEGWGKGAPEKYDYSTINQFGAPWAGYMPGWQESGYWQYQNATIDDLGKKIFMGNFTSKEERDRLYRTATEMIFQDPFTSLNPYMTIGQIIEEPLIIHGFDEKGREGRIFRALEDVRLSPPQDFIKKYPHMLSGGQRQRVGIARCLVLEPTFIVADEPVSMIDASSRAEILFLMRSLQEKYGMGIMYITHDIATAKFFSDRIAIMYAGKIVELGETRKVLKNTLHPYTAALIEAVPDLDPKNRFKVRRVVPGEPPSPINPPLGCRFHPRCEFKIQGLCDVKEPPEVVFEKDHFVKCWLHAENVRRGV